MNHEMSQRALVEAAADGLRLLADDARCRTTFAAPSSALRDMFSPAARRYVLAPDRAGFFEQSARLRSKGYRVSVEFAGPDQGAADVARAEGVVEEYLGLLAHEPAPDRIGLDLSRTGLAHSAEAALRNTGRITAAGALRGSEVVLGADGSGDVDTALAVHDALADQYDNLGITLQAHLHRTVDDALTVARPGRTVRLVKGTSPEPPGVALARGPALDDRYLDLAELLVDKGVELSLATQDAEVLAAAQERGLLEHVQDIEMLYGVQPETLRRHRVAGRPCRIHAIYGMNWWLPLMRRLADNPPMVLSALADIGRDRGPAGAPAHQLY
ncbi:proline dehydrogenase [Streptomyces sp. SM11]|uniref:proline dehydrogenase n=1 Tax=Streptomyces sp. SM11 TaxID=565557 RepID=UPI000CD4DF42|nr:proline dehydrogenase [Streptomyces sp. SM11]